MIQTEIIDEFTGDCLAQPNWTAIPNVGERFSTADHDYMVIDRGWGVCCDGNGYPLWGKQCVTLTVRKLALRP